MMVDWWRARKEELLALTEKECPLYIYNEEILNDIFFDLWCVDNLDVLFYPTHLNPHPEIIGKACEMGLSFLCRSSGELNALSSKFDKLNSDRIMFKCDNDRESNFGRAMQYGAHMVMSDPWVFRVYSDNYGTSDAHGVLISIDSQNILEYGLWPETAVKGFYLHIKPEYYLTDANEKISLISRASGRFPEALTVMLGNDEGVGVCHAKCEMDIRNVERYLDFVNSACPQFELWFEVPSSMLSSAGLLVARITETGEEGGRPFIRLNMDVNTSIGRRLDDAGHQVLNLSKLDEGSAVTTRIEGCNLSGGFEVERKLPSSIQVGDILLVTNMGVYEPGDSLNDQGRDGVAEHYLPARRICQVRL
ncbi:MAG: hypothetical protein R6U89_09385 [Dehalococcoidia bacterium]